MIKIKGLSKSYKDKKALDNLDLHIQKASIFGLLGPNGAGKTTLVSILNALKNYDEGEIFINGLCLKDNMNEIRRISSLIPQTLAFYENLSVEENLNFFAGIQGIKADVLKENMAYAIKVNRLSSMLKQKAKTLSGGQKRRLNIAIGLLNNPEIIYFDEPTVGIDPQSRNEILQTIAAFKNDNKTVVYTSHYMSEIEKICDDVAIINEGKIVKVGKLNELTQDENSACVYIDISSKYETVAREIVEKNNKIIALDESTLKLESNLKEDVFEVLSLLEKEGIYPKNIRYGQNTLESVFIALTKESRSDV